MGDISLDDRIQALNSVNFCRYLAGLPADVTLNDFYNETTQAASLVNASNDVLTHYPSQPSEMSDELYKLGSNGAKSSNIASGFLILLHLLLMDMLQIQTQAISIE